jgi:alpha-galactosidase
VEILDAVAITSSGDVISIDPIITMSPLDGGISISVQATIANSASPIDRVRLRTNLTVREALEHGWQSWSTIRPTSPGDRRPVRAEAPRWFRNQMLADGEAAGWVLSADTVLVHPLGTHGALSILSHPITFRIHDNGEVDVDILLDGLRVEAGREIKLGEIWSWEGDPGVGYSKWAELSGALAGRREAKRQPFGWCSWYQYFTDVTADDVRRNLALAATHGLELVQIDDGWQREIGDWGATSPSFGAPIHNLAHEIRDVGLSAGIWSAPFLAIERGRIASERPEWLVRNERGLPRTALLHETWGGRVFALDATRPDVLEHLTETYRTLREWGFSYFKIDFLHAATVPGTRSADGDLSRVDALRNGLQAIREGIGDDGYLLGCGSPLGSSVGIVDALRVSEDVAAHWGPGKHFEGWKESSVGTINAIEQSLRRAPLHRRWFSNDPDCALLRPTDTDLTTAQRLALASVVTGTGGFTVVSDDLTTYGSREWDLLEAMGAARESVDTPVDLDNPLAEDSFTLRGGNHRLEVDLTEPSAALLTLNGSKIL